MTPRAIIAKAIERGLGMIAISDHNSAENVEAAIAAADSTSLTIIPGMEITSSEEVHILGLFDSVTAAQGVQKVIYEHLNPGQNNEEFFGSQYVVDKDDYVISENKRLLIGATDLSVSEVVETIHKFSGLAVAAHIDRERFGLLYQLGFLPEGLELDAVELTGNSKLSEVEEKFRCSIDLPQICDSDSHFLDDIGRRTTEFLVEAPTLSEIRLALKGIDGRWARCRGENHA